jgi:hypothetical protein
MKRDESNFYAPLRHRPATPSPEDAMRWPYGILLLVLLFVALGAAAAFTFAHWPAIEAAARRFFNF